MNNNIFIFFVNNTPLYFLFQSFWRDEAFSVLLAKEPIGSLLNLTAKDFNPPLYYLILHFWIKLFGPSEVFVRMLSLFWYFGILLVSWLTLKEIFAKRNTLFFVSCFLILVLNPLFVYYAFEARMYTMFGFFSVLSYYYFISNKPRNYFIATVFGFYTHYFMIIVWLSQVFNFFLLNKIRKDSLFLPNLRQGIFYLFLPFMLFFPWLVYIFLAKDGSLLNQDFWIKPISFNDLFFVNFFLFTGYEKELGFLSRRILITFSLVLNLILFYFVAKLFVSYSKKNSKNFLRFGIVFFNWYFISIVITIIFSLIKPIFLPRYLIGSSIGLIFFAIFFLLSERRYFIFFLFIFPIIFIYNHYQIKYRRKNDIKVKVIAIRKNISDSDYIITDEVLYYHTLKYYFPKNKVFLLNKNYNDIPQYVGKVLIRQDEIVTNFPNGNIRKVYLKGNGDFEILY